MQKGKKTVKEKIIDYTELQNIPLQKIKQDTGINLEEKKILNSEEFLTLCQYLGKKPEEFSGISRNEDEELNLIRQIAFRYQGLLGKLSGKVAFTLEGEAYFFRYNKDMDGYESFVHLKTAKQLEGLIAGVVAQEMVLNMQDELENAEEELDQIEQSFQSQNIIYEDTSRADDGSEYKKYMKLLIERLDKVIEIYDNRSEELKDLLYILRSMRR